MSAAVNTIHMLAKKTAPEPLAQGEDASHERARLLVPVLKRSAEYWGNHHCASELKRAIEIIEDLLPTAAPSPAGAGGEDGCDCMGTGEVYCHESGWHKCTACNGTGKPATVPQGDDHAAQPAQSDGPCTDPTNCKRCSEDASTPHAGIPRYAAAKPAQSDYPECSGDPSSCPENEGRGCCKPNPKSCTCPSGDGSLRWPCPLHTSPQPPADAEAVARELLDAAQSGTQKRRPSLVYREDALRAIVKALAQSAGGKP